MTLKSKVAAGLTVTAMAVTPMALASGAAAHPGNGHSTTPKTHHTPSKGSKAEDYGKLCKGQSKQHVKGQKGTPFSQCVDAMRTLDQSADPAKANPTKACSPLSHKHTAGEPGTPFSNCVAAGHKLLAAKKHAATATR